MNFDRIADHYYWLETLAFGSALQRARTYWLEKLTRPSRALIVGEGNGRFLCELLRVHPKIEIDCLDASGRMLHLAEKRLCRKMPKALPQVRFLHQDVRTWPAPVSTYDLVVSHFFLDCFGGQELAAIVQNLAPASTCNAVWLIADFSIPSGSIARMHAHLWLKAMYSFFRATAGLSTQALVDPTPYLQANKFVRFERHVMRWGILKSEIWHRGILSPGSESVVNRGNSRHF